MNFTLRLDEHEKYMRRCLQLARLGAGRVVPNPVVGAVLVHEKRIIGEGYHQKYGGPHAEVHCINSVAEKDQALIPLSTLYVSLEPCAHFGKTPPCADLVIKMKIPRVVIGCRDPFAAVNGKGIEKLEQAGIEVLQGILEDSCVDINKRFFHFHQRKRPFIILKWAQTADGFIGNEDHSRLLVSGEQSNRIVHKWRSEEAAILVGTNTALFDDPSLTTRFWPGQNPIRLVIDQHLRLPRKLRLFSEGNTTIVFNLHQHSIGEKATIADLKNMGVFYYQVTEDTSLVHQVLNGLYQLGIQSVLVEGGAMLLQSFMDKGAWDEIRVITNTELISRQGVRAPVLNERAGLTAETRQAAELVSTYINNEIY